MCHYVNLRYIGCNHFRTAVLHRCDSNPDRTCPANCFRSFNHPDECINMPNKCPECDPNPSTAPVNSPSIIFSYRFRKVAKDLVSRGQWTSYNEMQVAFRKLFHWDVPTVPADKLFNEDGEASSRLTPLKRDMMQKLDTIKINNEPYYAPIHGPIWFS